MEGHITGREGQAGRLWMPRRWCPAHVEAVAVAEGRCPRCGVQAGRMDVTMPAPPPPAPYAHARRDSGGIGKATGPVKPATVVTVLSIESWPVAMDEPARRIEVTPVEKIARPAPRIEYAANAPYKAPPGPVCDDCRQNPAVSTCEHGTYQPKPMPEPVNRSFPKAPRQRGRMTLSRGWLWSLPEQGTPDVAVAQANATDYENAKTYPDGPGEWKNGRCAFESEFRNQTRDLSTRLVDTAAPYAMLRRSREWMGENQAQLRKVGFGFAEEPRTKPNTLQLGDGIALVPDADDLASRLPKRRRPGGRTDRRLEADEIREGWLEDLDTRHRGRIGVKPSDRDGDDADNGDEFDDGVYNDNADHAYEYGPSNGDKIGAIRQARERAEQNQLDYLEHGTDAVELQHRKRQELVDDINRAAVAGRLSRGDYTNKVSALLHMHDWTPEPDGYGKFRFVSNETSLRRLANASGVKTQVLRGEIALGLRHTFVGPLAKWAKGREGTGAWLGAPTPSFDLSPAILYFEAQAAAPRQAGRPTTQHPARIASALRFAQWLCLRLYLYGDNAVQAIEGGHGLDALTALDKVTRLEVDAYRDGDGRYPSGVSRIRKPGRGVLRLILSRERNLKAVCVTTAAGTFKLPASILRAAARAERL